ncbi:hypothetical protein P8452_17994 [Trifolium repens]|nr:hypothetical protein P8452_17994 [Trifolium repens]
MKLGVLHKFFHFWSMGIKTSYKYTDSDNMLYMLPNTKDIEEARWYQSNCSLKYGRRPRFAMLNLDIFGPHIKSSNSLSMHIRDGYIDRFLLLPIEGCKVSTVFSLG